MTQKPSSIPVSLPETADIGAYVAAHEKQERASPDDDTIVAKKIQRITLEDTLSSEDWEWYNNEKCLAIPMTAFSTNGVNIHVQGKRKLLGISVDYPGSAGVILNVYDDYYTSGGGQLKHKIDCSATKDKDCRGEIFSKGIFAKMPDPGSGTPPHVVFYVK